MLVPGRELIKVGSCPVLPFLQERFFSSWLYREQETALSREIHYIRRQATH